MNIRRDQISSYISCALEALLLNSPTRTSLGIVLGCVLDFFFNLFSPVISQIRYIAPEKVKSWHFIPLGIFIIYLLAILRFIFIGDALPEIVENALRLIKQSNLSEAEKRQQYRTLIQKVLEQVSLNKETETKMKLIQEQLPSQK